jgi:tetratricopeptide (TPR) repeat protein
MKAYDLQRAAAEDRTHPGIALDSPAQREVERVLHAERLTSTGRYELFLAGAMSVSSRAQVLTEFADDPFLLTFCAGEYRTALPLWKEQAEAQERQGSVANAVAYWSQHSRCHTALGNLDQAEAALDRAQQLAERLPGRSGQLIQVLAAAGDLLVARGGSTEDAGAQMRDTVATLARESPIELRWVGAALRAAEAGMLAFEGQSEAALQVLAGVADALERAPGWAGNYLLVTSSAVHALWTLRRADYVEILERNLREKILPPDFRYPSTDARLFLGMLDGLVHRYDEASRWFAEARIVLDEQGARPLRALVDFREAELFLDRDVAGDRERAWALLHAALSQFREIGMDRWVERAEALRIAEQAKEVGGSA